MYGKIPIQSVGVIMEISYAQTHQQCRYNFTIGSPLPSLFRELCKYECCLPLPFLSLLTISNLVLKARTSPSIIIL
jgi:hypothetical protein